MPRSLIRHTVRTDTGPVVVGAVVEPRLEGTATPLPDAFAAETGGSAVTSFVTNDQGEVIIWTDTWRDQIDLRVSSAAGTHLAGAVGTSFSFAAFTETVAVPALMVTFVDLTTPQTVTALKTFAGGVDISGSPSGYTAELRLVGGAGGEYGLSTNATGSPAWDFDHRGAGNTGSWVWRNGTGAGTARLRLLAGGDLEFPTGTLRFLAVHVRTTAATAGTSGAPPAQVAGYITTRMDGVDIKLPYYNP